MILGGYQLILLMKVFIIYKVKGRKMEVLVFASNVEFLSRIDPITVDFVIAVFSKWTITALGWPIV
jgi:hypothetical protein